MRRQTRPMTRRTPLQHVAPPGIGGDRERAVEHDRADVLGMARRVDRHQERAVGVAPQVELVDAERRPHGLDVVGDGGRAVEAGARTEVVGAERPDDGLVERQRVARGEARAAQRARLGPCRGRRSAAGRAASRSGASAVVYRRRTAIVESPGPPGFGTIVPSAGRLVSVRGRSDVARCRSCPADGFARSSGTVTLPQLGAGRARRVGLRRGAQRETAEQHRADASSTCTARTACHCGTKEPMTALLSWPSPCGPRRRR